MDADEDVRNALLHSLNRSLGELAEPNRADGLTRHLVLGGTTEEAAAGLVTIACAQPAVAVAYDPAQHTYLTRLATCAECRAVHAAWNVAFVASLD